MSIVQIQGTTEEDEFNAFISNVIKNKIDDYIQSSIDAPNESVIAKINELKKNYISVKELIDKKPLSNEINNNNKNYYNNDKKNNDDDFM